MIRIVFSCCDYFPFFHRIHGSVFRPDGALTSYPRERVSFLACTGSVSSQQRDGASGTGKTAMTFAVYSIIHHPLSQQNAGPAEGLPVLFPQWRGSCYRAEQCSTSFSRCRGAAPDAPADRPPQCGGKNACGSFGIFAPAPHSARRHTHGCAVSVLSLLHTAWSSPPFRFR